MQNKNQSSSTKVLLYVHVDINSNMFLLMPKFSRTTFELKEMEKKKKNAK